MTHKIVKKNEYFEIPAHQFSFYCLSNSSAYLTYGSPDGTVNIPDPDKGGAPLEFKANELHTIINIPFGMRFKCTSTDLSICY